MRETRKQIYTDNESIQSTNMVTEVIFEHGMPFVDESSAGV